MNLVCSRMVLLGLYELKKSEIIVLFLYFLLSRFS